MLRLLAATLVLANLLVLAWTQGWLAPAWPAPGQAQREPARLAAQVRPEAIGVVPASAASAAVRAALAAARDAVVCLQSGRLAEADLAAAETTMATLALPAQSWTRESEPVPPRWLVYAGPFPEPSVRRAREKELKAAGLRFGLLAAEPADAPAAAASAASAAAAAAAAGSAAAAAEEPMLEVPTRLRPGLDLGRHLTREAAEAALAALRAEAAATPAPLRGLRVEELPEPPPRWHLRVARADAATAARLQALGAEAPGGGFTACETRP